MKAAPLPTLKTCCWHWKPAKWKRLPRFVCATRGEVIDLTSAYDNQDIVHTEPVKFERQFINTTVGRTILNDHLPEEHAVHQRPA